MDGIARDKIEQSKEYLAVIDGVNALLREEFPPDKSQLGRCHQVWARKKQILKAYGICWSSPAELNPHIHFD